MNEILNRDSSPIRASGLVKHYGDLAALDELSMQIPAGTIHGLLGPNGAGKSTVVNALSTLVDLSAGKAEIAGFDVSRQAAQVRSRIGLVGQTAALDEILGGRQNLMMFGRLFGLSRSNARRRTDELLDQFDLTEAADRPVSTYSGGMRRRLDIAVGMVLDPVVLFLDEPTTGLDPRGRTDVWNSVRDIAARGTTVLLTTQYLEEADSLANRISIMKAGKIIAEGTPLELKRQRGGDRIEITAGEQVTVQNIQEALNPTDAASSEMTAVELDDAAGVVTCPAPRGTQDLAAVVRRLDAAGISPDDIALRRPTLDEVFLALTEKENA